MKIDKIFSNTLLVTSGVMLFLMSACLKKSDDFPKHDPALVFKGDDLVKTLNTQPSLHLFSLAVKRLGFAESIGQNSSYTVFALTDSAMKAHGLDSAGINKLNLDSLRGLISYQVSTGALDDQTLTDNATTLQVFTLKQQIKKLPSGAVTITQAPLFLKEKSKIYFNGIPVTKTGPVITAFNGFIYPVSDFNAQLPAQTIGDILSSDPELSLFNQALMIADSVFLANTGLNAGLSLPAYFSSPPPVGTSMLPTLLAPTNKAFNDAGFYTADDLRSFATRYLPTLDFNDLATVHYSSLDSLLDRHIIMNDSKPAYQVRVLYYDLLGPLINTSPYNTFVGGLTSAFSGGPNNTSALKYTQPLVFSEKNGLAYVKWTNSPKEQPVLIPLDVSPKKPVNNYVASNGSVFKINKLFFPIQK